MFSLYYGLKGDAIGEMKKDNWNLWENQEIAFSSCIGNFYILSIRNLYEQKQKDIYTNIYTNPQCPLSGKLYP